MPWEEPDADTLSPVQCKDASSVSIKARTERLFGFILHRAAFIDCLIGGFYVAVGSQHFAREILVIVIHVAPVCGVQCHPVGCLGIDAFDDLAKSVGLSHAARRKQKVLPKTHVNLSTARPVWTH